MSFFNTLIDKKGGSKKSYFISNAGNNGNSGLSPNSPITASEINQITNDENTSFYFKCGEIFELGDWNINKDNIKILPYGSGSKPLLTGSVSISSNTWVNEGSGLYSTMLGQAPKWLYINGVSANYSETNWIGISGNSGNTITVNPTDVAQYSNIVGAKLWSKQYNFRPNYEYTVTNYNSTTGVITVDAPITVYISSTSIKLVGQKQFLSSNGDWWYESSTQKLFIKTITSPAGTNIRISVKNNCFSISNGVKGFLTDNIEYSHYYNSVFESTNNDYFTVSNCSIHDIRTDGFIIKGNPKQCDFSNNSIYNIGSNAFRITTINNSKFVKNTIYNIGVDSSVSLAIDLTYVPEVGIGICMVAVSGNPTTANNCLFYQNTIYNTAYCGMLLGGDNHVVYRNVVYDFMKIWADGGGIYAVYPQGYGSSTKNITIKNNLVYGGQALHSCGVYIDNGCEGFIVENNYLFDNAYTGILVNFDTRNSIILNNTCARNKTYQIIFSNDPGNAPRFPNNIGNTFIGNIMISNSLSNPCIQIFRTDSTDFNPFEGGISNYNKYVSPYSEIIANLWGVNRNLTQFKGILTSDNNSSELSNYKSFTGINNNEIYLTLNPFFYVTNINAPGGTYIDENGLIISTKDLLPISGFAFMKQ